MSWSYIPGHLLNDMKDGKLKLMKITGHENTMDWDRMRSKYTDIEPRGNDSLLWYAIDLDKTLAQSNWSPDNPTFEIGEPMWENIRKAREVEAAGYKIIVHTSRPWGDYENIEGWLNHYNVPYRRIVCGKLLAIRYVDDKAINADEASWLPEEE
jgi:hypothetical protein